MVCFPENPPDGDHASGADGLDSAVFVALGCNDKGEWPNCQALLERALVLFEERGIRVVARSAWWSSLAWPDPTDPPFVNGVAQVETILGPQRLMQALSRIEDEMGRFRALRNAPRTLDLDLIAHGRLSGSFEGVTLPHPRAAQRLFVMGPLAQIAPAWVHPTGETAQTLAASATVGTDAFPIGQQPGTGAIGE